MAFKNCELNENDRREYNPGYPYMDEVFKPQGGTIDFENNIRLFNYGNGPVDEPSDLYQFILDYKGFPLEVEFKQILCENDVYWRGCSIKQVKDFPYDYKDVIQTLRDALKVYAYVGYSFSTLMQMNEKAIVHIEF